MANEILVTGAGGFIGGTAMETLRNAGENVVGTDKKIESELAQKLKLQRLDSSDKEATNKLIWDLVPSTIFHFAGIAMPKEVAGDEALGHKINVESVMNLLDAIILARRKDPGYNPIIIVAGSVEQFGDPKEGEPAITEDNPVTESSPRNAVTPYGRQKEEMSVKFLEKCRDNNIRGFVVIQGQVSGVSPSGEISQRTGFLIPDLGVQVATIIKSGEKQGVVSSGPLLNRRPILDVKDAVDAYLKIAEENPIPGEYIVCAEESRPLIDVLTTMITSSGLTIVRKINKAFGDGGPNRFYSSEKVRKATVWNPKVQYERMIQDVLEFQRKYGK